MSARLGVAQKSHKKPRPRPNLSWQEQARCVEADDPEIFFDPDRYTVALAMCADCPVKQQCRELGKGMGPGVWGGRVQNSEARGGFHQFLRLPHGTEAAYQRHIRLKQDPCPACVEGSRQARRARALR